MRVSAEQCLHSTKGFSAPPTAPPASRLGVPKALGGDTAGTSAPNSPKGYPTAREAVLSNKTGGWRMAGAALARGLAGHRSVGGEQLLSFASLGFLGLSFPHSFLSVGFFPLPFLFSFLSSLDLNPRVFSLLPFPFSPANPPAGERASGRVVLSRWPGLNRNDLSAKESPTEGESACPASSVRVRASPGAQRDARKPQQSACCWSRFQSFLGERTHF